MKPIPSRKRIPFVTDLLEFRQMITDPIGYCAEKVEKYGDVCHVPIPGVENYLIHDPEVIKEVLVTQAGKFCKSRLYRAMKRFVGEGLLTSEGSLHFQQRRLVAPAFHRQRVQEYAQTMVNCTVEETKNWKPGEIVNISQAMTNITMQIITQTIFGSQIEPGIVVKVSKDIGELIEYSGKILSNPVYLICLEKDIRLPIISTFYRLKKEIDSVINGLITDYRKAQIPESTDLLSMLLQSKDEDTGELMSDIQVKDEVMTMFLAGHETTATSLTWVWYLIGKNPEAEEQFYQEIIEKIGNRLPDADDYQTLNFTKNVFKEALRLYPPAWTFAREATEDVEIQGYVFPKGAVLCWLQYIVQRNEKYFANPNDFIPERWDDERIKDLPKYAYFPFGGGHRMCIGEGFAYMEAVMILATIASKYRLELPANFNTTINPVVTLRTKDNIIMNVVSIIN